MHVELDAILATDDAIDFINFTVLQEKETTRPIISPLSTTFIPQLDGQTISTFRQAPFYPGITPVKVSDGHSEEVNDKTTVSAMTMDSCNFEIESLCSSIWTLLQQNWNCEVQNGPAKPAEDTGKTVQANTTL